jgi:putative oxidoreductase
MARRHPIANWITQNRDMLWDLVRIYLGFALVVKGFVYMFQHRAFVASMVAEGVPFAGSGLAELVALAHIAGGLMMTFGILTRIGAIIQIPSVLGAVLFVHLKEGLFTSNQTLEFALLVLFLLCLIAVGGAGRLSIDYVFSERGQRREPQLNEPLTSS